MHSCTHVTDMSVLHHLENNVYFCSIDFRYIDQGKNPQLYTKDCMEKSLAKNEAVKGKIDAFKVS